MTKTESVQRAYRWAFNVSADRKTRFLTLYCAKQILSAIEASEDDKDVAYGSLLNLVREWASRHKDGLDRPINTLSKMLDVKTDELAEESSEA